jgi:hypothetical protein
MAGRRILGVLLVALLLLLFGISDCRLWAAADAQGDAVLCPHGLHSGATTANVFRGCGSSRWLAHNASARASLVMPSLTAELQTPSQELAVAAFDTTSMTDAPQHSPPSFTSSICPYWYSLPAVPA